MYRAGQLEKPALVLFIVLVSIIAGALILAFKLDKGEKDEEY